MDELGLLALLLLAGLFDPSGAGITDRGIVSEDIPGIAAVNQQKGHLSAVFKIHILATEQNIRPQQGYR